MGLTAHYTPGITGCAICCGDHATCRCACLTGVCFACGLRCDHGAKNCPHPALFPISKHFCIRCKLPLFELAGVTLHSSSCIGNECPNSALADQVKMLLLAGRAAGEAFGPASYQERVEWITEGSPPNIIDVLARVASQTRKCATPLSKIHASGSQLTPEQRGRICSNREAALQRMKDSSCPGLPLIRETNPSSSKGALYSPDSTVSQLHATPPTHARPIRQGATSTMTMTIPGAVYSVRTPPCLTSTNHHHQ
jgi:hypothetical protein